MENQYSIRPQRRCLVYHVRVQDNAPAIWAEPTQHFIDANFNDFIYREQWPPHSPDINPCDYFVWVILKPSVCEELNNFAVNAKHYIHVLLYKRGKYGSRIYILRSCHAAVLK